MTTNPTQAADNFVEAALAKARSMPHVSLPGDVAHAALGIIKGKLGSLASDDTKVLEWLNEQAEELSA